MSILDYFLKPSLKFAKVFIDTDNQPFTLAAGLQDHMDKLGRKIQYAVLAGNAHGETNKRWEAELTGVDPKLIIKITVPQRENAADAAILMMLGGVLACDDPNVLIVIASRDRLLAEAGLQLQESGLEVLMISQEGGSDARPTGVPVLTLPNLSTPQSQVSYTYADATSNEAMLALIKSWLPAVDGNLYLSSQVHDVLVKSGMTDKEERQAFINWVPGLSTTYDSRNVQYYCIP
jgi:hypothetical protein